MGGRHSEGHLVMVRGTIDIKILRLVHIALFFEPLYQLLPVSMQLSHPP